MAGKFKKADSTEGNKELREAVSASHELGLFCFERFRDGVGVDDFTAFYDKLTKDQAFMDKMKAGYEGAGRIPAEVKDLDVGEGMELAADQLSVLPKYVALFKKPEAS